MEPIDQVLDNVANRLQTKTEDPKIGAELAYEVRHFNREYGKAIGEIRQCKNVGGNFDRIVNAFIPQGAKLSQSISQTFEVYGLWNTETKNIADLLDGALIPGRFVEDAVNAIFMGCECRKH